MPIRRTLGRDGRVYYFNNRGRRIPESRGARQWVRENRDSVTTSQLSPREQRSFRASQRASQQFRFEGRFIPNPFGIFNRFLVASNLPPETRDLSNLFNQEQLNRVLNNQYTQDLSTFRNYAQNIFETYTTRSGDLLDSYEQINRYVRNGYNFFFVRDGQTYTGRQALEALRNFEQQEQQSALETRGDALENVQFNHRIRLNPQTRTIEIYADETEIILRGGTP
jgi:hypothetical protein